MDAYINNYEGHWQNEDGCHIYISIINETTAHVSFYTGEKRQPVYRPWFKNKPTFDMTGHYNPIESPELVVDLADPDSGFCLNLLYEDYLAINGIVQAALVPSISRYEEDAFLDQYYVMLGSLNTYTKCEKQKC